MKRLLYLIGAFLMISCQDMNMDRNDGASRNHTIATGLSNYNIYDIEEDSCGQIWIATFRGLNRFDSRDYYHYFANPDDSLSIPHDQIRDIIVDKKHRLWVGTVDGLCRHTDMDNFVQHPQLKSGIVFQMEHGPDSAIFINVNNSLRVLHTDTDTIETLLDEIKIENTFSPRLLVNGNRLWLVGRSAILGYDYEKRRVTDSIPTPEGVNTGFMVDDEIWMAGDTKTNIFDMKAKKFKPLPENLQAHPLFRNAELSFITS